MLLVPIWKQACAEGAPNNKIVPVIHDTFFLHAERKSSPTGMGLERDNARCSAGICNVGSPRIVCDAERSGAGEGRSGIPGSRVHSWILTALFTVRVFSFICLNMSRVATRGHVGGVPLLACDMQSLCLSCRMMRVALRERERERERRREKEREGERRR